MVKVYVCPEKGVPSGISETARNRIVHQQLTELAETEEWLAKDFVPKGVNKVRESRCATNLGDALAQALNK
jgi:hypothetical protein